MNNNILKSGEVQHMVIFNLPYAPHSADVKQFLSKSEKILAAIPGVKDFQIVLQTSKKNKFEYGFSMLFSGHDNYDAYNNHPAHLAYVRDMWIPIVTEFLEIDYETMG
ncbi:Dabb family protein [Labilibacter marinus]|uniref:Dabb family protein n=1 Tax=Labilibacter marinus TaxID=1477105 RepID=UPI00094FBE91|nr:Dabb family protein [Labilibacter marinus]